MNRYCQIRADEVSDLLRLLVERVAVRGASADLYVVGGVAMTLQFGRPTATPDIDPVLNPRDEVLAAAAGEESIAFSAPHDRVRGVLLLEAEDTLRTAAADPVVWPLPRRP